MTALAADLVDALATPTPRRGAAFRTLMRAQRNRWSWIWVFVIAYGLMLVIAYRQKLPMMERPTFWIMAVSSPFIALACSIAYASSRSLARHGVSAPAKLIAKSRGLYRIELDDGRGGLWFARRVFLPDAPVRVLYHPRGRAAFVWVGRVSDSFRQDRVAPLPVAKQM